MSALEANDAEAVQHAVFNLGLLRDANGIVPDEVADALLDILKREEIQKSEMAGHLLNFFEFESPRISSSSKDKCLAFLKRWGDYFNTVHGAQVVTELRYGEYLKA